MKNANSSTITSEDAIILYMLDWWISTNFSTVASVIEFSSLNGCSSFRVSEVGRCILEQWDGWEIMVLGDIRGSSLGSFFWDQSSTSQLQNPESWQGWEGSWQHEFACRVGVMAKDAGWIAKHRREISKNQRAIRTIKKVQES